MARGAIVEADATALFNLARSLEGMDKHIQRAIKSTLTNETKKVVSAVRREVLAIPVKGGGGPQAFESYRKHQRNVLGKAQGPLSFQQDGGVRQAIARGVRSSIRYGSQTRGASIAVIGSSHFLPPDKKVMNRVLNYPSWRHPVFARGTIRNIDEFVQQVVRKGGYSIERTSSHSVNFQGRFGRKHSAKSWVWVAQSGHPFFGRVTSQFRQPIHEALVKAFEQVMEQEAEFGHS